VEEKNQTMAIPLRRHHRDVVARRSAMKDLRGRGGKRRGKIFNKKLTKGKTVGQMFSMLLPRLFLNGLLGRRVFRIEGKVGSGKKGKKEGTY